ncbi:MAG: Rieske (2Fe-2S) protein [Caulobacter sp.]|nr:Rieske (2Fe-2S) protein [Caulobacter sp.]
MSAAAETLPAVLYRDPAQWQAERRGVFAKAWQFFVHESAVAAPGAWAAETLAGFPLLVVRGHDGVLRGFHNVCRHRAGPLSDGEAGVCEAVLTCRYHGWTYTLDGRLRAARDFGPAEGFDPRDFGLLPIRVETWRGLVFVNIDLDASPLGPVVAPLERRLEGRDWNGLTVMLKRSHAMGCNWKTYVENYLEGYHVPAMHPGLDAEIDSARYEVEVEGRVVVHTAPLREPGAVYDGLWAWLWPNLGVNIYGQGLMLERMSPVGHDRTRLDYIYLMPAGETVAAETLAMSDQVVAEDIWIVERVQENLNAGVYETGRLSPRHEGAVAAFQAFVRDAVSPGP